MVLYNTFPMPYQSTLFFGDNLFFIFVYRFLNKVPSCKSARVLKATRAPARPGPAVALIPV